MITLELELSIDNVPIEQVSRETLKVSKALEPEQVKPLDTDCHIFQCDSAKGYQKI